MAQATYMLDGDLVPGEIAVRAEGHPTYLAQTYHTAEIFAQQLAPSGVILLDAECETTRDQRIASMADRYILAQQLDRFTNYNSRIAEARILGLI
jgi:hypothetical protein